jgi:hypothetical protein
MKRNEISLLVLPHLKPRLQVLIGDRDLGNGTPLADAVACAAAIDVAKGGRRVAKDPAGAVAAIDDETLAHMARIIERQITRRYENKDDYLTLPHGVVTSPGHCSGIYLGSEHLVPIRGLPGLHVTQDRDFSVDGPGCRKLIAAVAARAARLPRMDVPRPTSGDMRIARDQYHNAVIAYPIRSGPGTTCIHEYQIRPPEHMLDADIYLVVEAVVEHMREAWKDRDEIDRKGDEMWGEIAPIVEKAQADGLPIRFLGAHLSGPGTHGSRRTLTCAIETLGNDLKPMTHLAHVWNTKLTTVVGNHMSTLKRRKRILDDTAEKGARGRIELVTLAAIRHYAGDETAILRRIADERRMQINTGRPGAKLKILSLTWRDGRVQATFAFNKDVSWNQGRLIVNRTAFPEAVIEALPGRSVEMVLDHPFMNPGDVVSSVRTEGRDDKRWTTFNMQAQWTTFDSGTGRVDDHARAA